MSINVQLTVRFDRRFPIYCLTAEYPNGKDLMGPAIGKLVGDCSDLKQLALMLPTMLPSLAPGNYSFREITDFDRTRICYTLYDIPNANGNIIEMEVFGGNELSWAGCPTKFEEWMREQEGWNDLDW